MSARNGSAAVTAAAEEQGEDPARQSAPLDQLLSDAAIGPVSAWMPGRAGLEVAARLAVRPHQRRRRALGLTAELAKVAAGRSEVEPPKGDRRFKDPAWTGNPAFRRLAQAYLAAARTADGLVTDADAGWRAERRVRFVVDNVVDALAPSNFPLLNPAVLKATLDTGGRNFVHGAAPPGSDMATPPRIPAMVDRRLHGRRGPRGDAGGGGPAHAEVFELIQYPPRRRRCASCRCWSSRR